MSASRPYGAALEATADALVRRALAVLPADRPRGRADVARLPSPIAHVLDARLDALIEAVTPTSEYVDPAVAHAATSAWRAAAWPAAQFPAGKWAEAVREAARQALAHLVAPAETLAEAAVAGEDKPVPVGRAMARMRAFGPYPYFPEIVARYVERKGLDTLDRDGLERLLRRIHGRMVAQFGPDEWALLLEPLFALAAPVGRPVGTVSPVLLRPLLATDGPGPADALGAAPVRLDELRERLAADGAAPDVPFQFDPEPAAPAPGEPSPQRVATSRPELRPPPMPPVAEGVRPPVIGSRYRTPEEAFDEESAVIGRPRPAAPPAAPAETPEEAPAEAPPLSPVADTPDDEEPLWMQLARERGEGPVHHHAAADDEQPLWRRFATDAPAEETPADEAPAEEAPAKEDAFVADEDAFVAEEPPPAPSEADALEARVLGTGARDNRDWFVGTLFDGDEAAYLRTLARLGEASSYTAATTVISDDVFRAYRVSPYTDAAVAFTDAVQAQFGGR